MEFEYCQVVTTVGSREEADTLAGSAVADRAAACAQVSGPIASTYWWQGSVETAPEWQVVFKTTVSQYAALAEHIRSRHSYEVPEILCVPVLAGHPPYLAWLTSSTSTYPEGPQ